MKFSLTGKALEDIESCLLWSAENFGIQAAHRYKILLETAFLAICADPHRNGSKQFQGLEGGILMYHIRHSRKDAPVNGLIVKNPRHFLVYRKGEKGSIEVLRVLHDQMDLDTNLNKLQT